MTGARAILATAAVLMVGGGAAIAGSFVPPQGCTGYLSVQSRGCTVSHHYICAADPEGQRWRVDYDAEGPFFLSLIDHEGQWLYSRHLMSGLELVLEPENPDPASMSALIATGQDSYDFTRAVEGYGSLRVKGFDRLTGKTVQIDGVALAETAFEYVETGDDGAALTSARGNEYFHAGWRLFFSGHYVTEDGPQNRAPARFDEQGDPGFLSDAPEYDCADQMAALAPLRAPLIPTAAVATFED